MVRRIRKADALDYVYARYQIDREELDAIALLKAVDPSTDIVAMCDVFIDVARDQQADQQAKDAAADRAAMSELVNAVVQAMIGGLPLAVIKGILKEVLQ